MNIIELKKIRNTYGLTRNDFAEMLKISKDTLDLWEYRNKEVPADKVEYIKNVFNMYFDNNESNSIEVKKEKSFEHLSVDAKLNYLYKQNEDLKEENDNLKDLLEDLTLKMEISLAPILRHFKLKADDSKGKFHDKTSIN